MPELTDIANSSVSQPGPELREAVVLDDATALEQEVRCTIKSLDPLLASDPLAWRPVTTAAGVFYPKKDDRALVTFQPGGPPLIVWWHPSSAEPDAAIASGLDVIVHGEDADTPRGSGDHYVWVGSVVPTNAAPFDFLAKYA